MALHRLVFDTSDAASIANSANVGAYIRSDDGTLITHHTVGGDEGLDVYLVNASITVTATDFDIRDLSASQDNVAISDGTDTLAVNGDGSLNAVVTATDLDIRDLTHASDSVRLGDGTTLTTVTTVGPDNGLDVYLINSEINVNLQDGAGNDLTSTGGALDINIASSDIEIDVEDDLADIAIASASETVTTTSGALNTSDLANRRFIWMYNNGNKIVYIGPSGVATSDGFPIFPGGILEARIGPNVAIHAVAESGSQDVRTLQAS